jgi:hypothetical protein
MKTATITRSQVVFLLVLQAAQACSSGRDASGPPAPDLSRATIAAVSRRTIFGLSGSLSNDPPAVRIVTGPDNVPISGLTVTFSVAGTKSTTFAAVTGKDGVARLDSLRMDPAAGLYSIFAAVNGLPSLKFTAMAFSQAPIAIYDLQTQGSVPIPRTYTTPPPGFPSYTVTGGYYVLFGDGSYIVGFESNFSPMFEPSQRFIKSSSDTIDFYAVRSDSPPPGGFPDPGYEFSRGTISGDLLAVQYFSPEFEDEVYALRQ